MENERLRDRLRATHEDLAKCKDQLDNAFQVVQYISTLYVRLTYIDTRALLSVVAVRVRYVSMCPNSVVLFRCRAMHGTP